MNRCIATNNFLERVALRSTWPICLATMFCLVGCNFSANRHNSLGTAQFESGQIAQAINEFQTALARNPNNPDAYYNLAASYYALGKQSNNQQWLTQSEQLYRQAIQLNDQHAEAHRGLACLLVDTNRKQYAFDLLNSWHNRYPTKTEPLIELARLHQEFGDNRRATDLVADALKINSQDTRALKAMGYLREVQGQYVQALENYNRSLQIDGSQADVARQINSLQVRMAQASQQNPTR